jgi:hypothetical protein
MCNLTGIPLSSITVLLCWRLGKIYRENSSCKMSDSEEEFEEVLQFERWMGVYFRGELLEFGILGNQIYWVVSHVIKSLKSPYKDWKTRSFLFKYLSDYEDDRFIYVGKAKNGKKINYVITSEQLEYVLEQYREDQPRRDISSLLSTIQSVSPEEVEKNREKILKGVPDGENLVSITVPNKLTKKRTT